jgi:DNA-binding NarL/FixJ family response regulator
MNAFNLSHDDQGMIEVENNSDLDLEPSIEPETTNPPITILIVDDHAIVREGLRAMLESQENLNVIGEASNGLSAIQLVDELEPRVVLMDISMPIMDGLEATAKIKAQHPTVTVIILTMYRTESHVLQAIRAGASGYLLKDSPRNEVLETIRAASSGEVLISSELLRGAVDQLLSPSATQEVGIEDQLQLEPLTPRELDVLARVAQGKTNKEIAQVLRLSPETVKKMVQSIIAKLNASDRTHAAVKALRAGLI